MPGGFSVTGGLSLIAGSGRPSIPCAPMAGTEWRVVEDTGWRVLELLEQRQMQCRYIIGPAYARCPNSGLAALNRGRWDHRRGIRHDSWWVYCAEHMYGRWIEEGQIVSWRLQRISA